MNFDRFVNKDEIRTQIAQLKIDAKAKNHDIYIVTKRSDNTVINVFDDVDLLLKFLDRRNYKTCNSINWLFDYIGFLSDFCNDTNKYRTFDKKRVWKLNKTLELGNKPDVIEITRLKKEPKVQIFLREKKFKRILK